MRTRVIISQSEARAYLLVKERGQLVDETLPGARGQEGEARLASHDPLDSLLLLANKRVTMMTNEGRVLYLTRPELCVPELSQRPVDGLSVHI